MKKTTLPVGMHDKLFKRARVTYKIERDISDFLMSQGFNRIETPTLEHFEVFSDTLNKNNYPEGLRDRGSPDRSTSQPYRQPMAELQRQNR